jgi:hypothetical protein
MDTNLKQKSFDWVKNAIESSNNPFHIEGCRKLIELFSSKFEDSTQEGELLDLLLLKTSQINYL